MIDYIISNWEYVLIGIMVIDKIVAYRRVKQMILFGHQLRKY